MIENGIVLISSELSGEEIDFLAGIFDVIAQGDYEDSVQCSRNKLDFDKGSSDPAPEEPLLDSNL